MKIEKFYGVRLKQCGVPVDDSDIFNEINCTFNGSDLFYEFYKTYNGGYANKQTIYVDFPITLRYFFYVKKPFDKLHFTIQTKTNFFKSDAIGQQFLVNAIIISQDSGGNPIYIDSNTGQVFYTPTDVGEDIEDFEKYFLAENFGNFLKKLDYQSNFAIKEGLPNIDYYKKYENWWDELL
ncbi:SMI1/KNR4 family protein [Bartonella sp. HY761]|uniref:SMI1/KNR4 family protein n=1 Tax=Bartonella sp. HY761 TaxID=2979330 RepID=UPI00220FB2A4|nr:SMI1/KNR4 family protein [Bartonella sp. HY761]UXN07131.1 SMI1/KNR4 family protein [Bartonella sp. HY761]